MLIEPSHHEEDEKSQENVAQVPSPAPDSRKEIIPGMTGEATLQMLGKRAKKRALDEKRK